MAGILDGIPKYWYYGGPGHSGSGPAPDPFDLTNGDYKREFVRMPYDALDWIFFWHDIRYSIAKLKGGATADYKKADSQLLKDIEAIDKSLISEEAKEYISKADTLFRFKKIYNNVVLPFNEFWQIVKNSTVESLANNLYAYYPSVVTLIQSPAEKWYEIRYEMNEYVRDPIVADFLYGQAGRLSAIHRGSGLELSVSL
jgi:hypothetical protein